MLHDPNAHRDHRAVSRLELIGIATDAGASRRGSAMGPAALRVAELAERLTDLGYLVEDRGDFRADRGLTAKAEIDTLARRSSAAGYDSLKSGARPIFLGGDHSISMGSVAGVARHCRDIGKARSSSSGSMPTATSTRRITSETGNIHGMALAMLCGEPDFDDRARLVRRGRSQQRRDHRRPFARSRRARAHRLARRRCRRHAHHRRVRRRRPAPRLPRARREGRRPSPSLARRRRDGPVHRARRRHHRPRRPHLPRGAPHHGADPRLRVPRLARHRRAQPLPRPRRQERRAPGRSHRQPLRPADPVARPKPPRTSTRAIE